jgi:signal transduction histidine kinase
VRRRITLLVAATTSVVLLAFLLPAAVLVSRVAKARAIDVAQAQIQPLVPTVGFGEEDAVAAALVGLSDVGVRWIDGRWLGREGDLPDGQVPQSQLTVDTDDGVQLLQPITREDGVPVIEAFVPEDRLREGVTRTWLVLGGLGAVLLLLALVVADRLARSLTRPVTDLAETAHRLGSGDLSARVTPDGPAEVQEVGTALNRLAGRIDELLAAEREAAADLAHRLRTPLTALRLDVETLPAADRERLAGDVDALSRGIDEVISEARRTVREGVGAGCDAAAVVGDRVRFWSVLAEEEQRAVAVELPAGPLPVRVAAADLAAAVDALLGNVFAHTPEGTGFRVAVRECDDRTAELLVADAGPGLHDPATALERGRSGGGSTGLGLDIARRTAEASGGTLRLSSSPAGTTVALELGRAPAPPG